MPARKCQTSSGASSRIGRRCKISVIKAFDRFDMIVLIEDPPATKFVVEIFTPPKPAPTPKQYVDELKGAVGGKQIAKMKKEAVVCPVLNRTVSAVQCFACPNFIRRVKGKVDCRGLPLPTT